MRNRGWFAIALATGVAAVFGLALADDVGAQQRSGTAHTIFLTALEVKGSTTTDKLAPPSVNPKDIS